MLLEELLRCQIQEWYPTFHRHTIRTVLLPLPTTFLRYLTGEPLNPNADPDESDSPPLFLLPTISSGRSPFPATHANLPDPVSLLDRDNTAFFGSDSDGSDSDSSGNLQRPAFPELEAAVDAAIGELGGTVFPKLNWSAPKDAAWIAADGSLQCRSFADVAMLLRASDCAMHDLVYARTSCSDYVGRHHNKEGVRRNSQESGSDGVQSDGVGSGECVDTRCNDGEFGGDRGRSSRNRSNGEDVRRNAEESVCSEVISRNGAESNDNIGPYSNAMANAKDKGLRTIAGSTSDGSPRVSVKNGDMSASQNAVDEQEDGVQGNTEGSSGDDGFLYYLALRRWYPGLRSESEFRCFVRGRRLIAVSQRDPSAFYPSLAEWCAEVRSSIEAFFVEIVEPRFGSENYTFDVYVRADKVVKLIDFNPWGAFTLPLLFTWEELEEEGRGEEVEYRVVQQRGTVRPSLMTAVPFDMLDWGEGSGWDVFMKKAEEELQRQRGTLGRES